MLVNWKILDNHTLWFKSPAASPFFSVNLFSICIDDRLFFIDSGPYPYVFSQLINKLPKKWQELNSDIIVTHHDFDHSLGHTDSVSNNITNIYAHKRYYSLLNSVTAQWITNNKDDLNLPSVVSPQPNLTIERECLISKQLKIIPTPGHTSDSISVYDLSTETLYAGDAVEIDSIPYIGESGSLENWLETIDLICSINPKYILPGHGSIIDCSILPEFKQYFINLQKKDFSLDHSSLFCDLIDNYDSFQIHESNVAKCR